MNTTKIFKNLSRKSEISTFLTVDSTLGTTFKYIYVIKYFHLSFQPLGWILHYFTLIYLKSSD